jgi:2-methylisocitrate lyase-like PEP mutase family enzyme
VGRDGQACPDRLFQQQSNHEFEFKISAQNRLGTEKGGKIIPQYFSLKDMDVTAQAAKAGVFKMLHEREGLFIIPNPWDAGSATILEHLGFEALATTSAGLAFSLGRADGVAAVSREETLDNARMIVNASCLPVAADLENGFDQRPEACAETILMAAGVGLAGGSIEDTSADPAKPVLPFGLAVERVKAAVEAARSLSFPFTFTARAENLIYGRPDLKDTIKRLEAFADAGADVLFAPGLKNLAEVEAVVKAVAPKPVNVLLGGNHPELSVLRLRDLGVKRISLGSSLARTAYHAFFRAAQEVSGNNSFTFAQEVMPYGEMNALFKKKK